MKVTDTVFIHWKKYAWEEQGSFRAMDMKMDATPEYVFIREEQITFEVPDDFDPIPDVIANMKAKKQEILADAQVKANNIEEQIQRLLCIEHKPEVA